MIAICKYHLIAIDGNSRERRRNVGYSARVTKVRLIICIKVIEMCRYKSNAELMQSKKNIVFFGEKFLVEWKLEHLLLTLLFFSDSAYPIFFLVWEAWNADAFSFSTKLHSLLIFFTNEKYREILEEKYRKRLNLTVSTSDQLSYKNGFYIVRNSILRNL